MMEWINSALGTTFYSIVVFVAGAMIGAPLWCWMKSKCPFMSKCEKCH